jgi:hypothetical protein
MNLSSSLLPWSIKNVIGIEFSLQLSAKAWFIVALSSSSKRVVFIVRILPVLRFVEPSMRQTSKTFLVVAVGRSADTSFTKAVRSKC